MALYGRVTGSVCFLTYNYYSKLTLNYSKVKLFKTCSSRILFVNKHSCNRFSHNDSSQSMQTTKNYVKFDELVAKRRLEAQRSVLIEVQSVQSYIDLVSYCSQFGELNQVFHYNTKTNRNFFFIEFQSQESIAAVLSDAKHSANEQIIPVQSTMLWFRKPYKLQNITLKNHSIPPMTSYDSKPYNVVQLQKLLEKEPGMPISEQITLIYKTTKLGDDSTRLRFHMAHTIESCFRGLFPNVAFLPFGSSINGYGQRNCDLDLCTVLDENNHKKKSGKRLIFQNKIKDDRYVDIKLLEIVADTMDSVIPGIDQVKRILNARVPIIKFYNRFTEIECDLSMTNRSCYHMSELLYMYGEMDSRVRPLVFIVKLWASQVGLTSEHPGQKITNFSLLLMVIFFLQRKGILPPLNLLIKHATAEDIRIVDQGVNCTFQRDISKIPKSDKESNTDSLETLLLEFFVYFSKFDFEKDGISLNEGRTVHKPGNGPLYICYPFEIKFNVSKNVSMDELMRMKKMISYVLREMDTDIKVTRNILYLFFCARAPSMNLTKILDNNNKKDKILNNSSNKIKQESVTHN